MATWGGYLSFKGRSYRHFNLDQSIDCSLASGVTDFIDHVEHHQKQMGKTAEVNGILKGCQCFAEGEAIATIPHHQTVIR